MNATQDLAWFDAIPSGFAAAKPTNATIEELRVWHATGTLALQRKRDGRRHYLVRGQERGYVFTRGLQDVSSDHPDIVAAIEECLSPGSMLDAEFVVSAGTRDDFAASGTLLAQATGTFIVFDLLFLAGEAVYGYPYGQRYVALQALSDVWPRRIRLIEMLTEDVDAAVARCINEGWEGLCGWFLDRPTQISLNGSPKRCNVVRWKPVKEDDFVVTGIAEVAKGGKAGFVGSYALAQYRDGRLVKCGRANSADWVPLAEVSGWTWPRVAQVAFQKRTATGHCQFGRFLRWRDDKTPAECVWRDEE